MDKLIQRRVNRLNKLLEKGINPFLETKFERSHNFSEIKENFSKLKSGEETKQKEKVAGRVRAIRIHGGVAFVDLVDHTGKLQLVLREDIHSEPFEFVEEFIDDGDFIGVEGVVIKTKRGEISLQVSKLKLLSKALRPIPSEWYGLKDVEIRYRQRYLDLIMNEDVKKTFEMISTFTNAMRERMLKKGFTDVNTPILQPIYGGAFAKPFKTHHNFLKQDMFLRIAPELYLKRLIVGGFEGVFEFASCFRNESVDSRHNPEFIQMEAYKAFANYEDMMKLAEDVISYAVKKATGSYKVKHGDVEINFKAPWKRMTMADSLKLKGLDISKMTDGKILEEARKIGKNSLRVGDAIENLFSHYVESTLIQPTFITDFPSDISPLAKKIKTNPKLAQRFEIYIGGQECGNAFSELNNPIEQYLRFSEEEKFRKDVKIEGLEYMPMDKDYIRALEYGLPPTGGIGIGIARITSVLIGKQSVKEVILFPFVSASEKIENVAEIDKTLREKFGD